MFSGQMVSKPIIYPDDMALGKKHTKHLRILVRRSKLLREMLKEGIVAEIGVDEGDFSDRIIKISRPRKLHLIDSWGSNRYNHTKESSVRTRFNQEIVSGKVIIDKGDSLERLSKFNDGYFDWVYLDTTHKLQQTTSELELSRSKVKQGGVIAGHDFCRGITSSGDEYGVIEAVHGFCKKYDWEMLYLTSETSGRWSYALREGGST